jgi:hypothetical protein
MDAIAVQSLRVERLRLSEPKQPRHFQQIPDLLAGRIFNLEFASYLIQLCVSGWGE